MEETARDVTSARVLDLRAKTAWKANRLKAGSAAIADALDEPKFLKPEWVFHNLFWWLQLPSELQSLV
jgi:hypothetical protein